MNRSYVTDTSYPDTFFRELSPVWLNYVAVLGGVPPRDLERPFTYLELGSGFGHSTIVNAGALPRGEFHACDFNPAHIEGARRQAAAFGIGNVEFHELSFAQLLEIDLPQFDFIVLHGVYSWVSAQARQEIRHIIQRKLKTGGLVYISYNCMPGWAVEVPLRRLLVELADQLEGDSLSRTEQALGALKQLSESRLRYFSTYPDTLAAIESYKRGPSEYLAHEFLNESWEPFYSIDVAEEMRDIGLRYVGSATLADNHPALVIDDEAARAIARLPTERQRQLASDFAAHRRFRRDVFVRAPVELSPAQMAANFNNVIIGWPNHAGNLSTRVRVPRGELHFQEDFIREVHAILSQGSMTIASVLAALSAERRNAAEIARNLTFLIAAGTLTPFAKTYRHEGSIHGRRLTTDTAERVLRYIIDHQVQRAVPSEILGNGWPIRPIEAEALAGWLEQGIEPPESLKDLLPRMARLGLLV